MWYDCVRGSTLENRPVTVTKDHNTDKDIVTIGPNVNSSGLHKLECHITSKWTFQAYQRMRAWLSGMLNRGPPLSLVKIEHRSCWKFCVSRSVRFYPLCCNCICEQHETTVVILGDSEEVNIQKNMRRRQLSVSSLSRIWSNTHNLYLYKTKVINHTEIRDAAMSEGVCHLVSNIPVVFVVIFWELVPGCTSLDASHSADWTTESPWNVRFSWLIFSISSNALVTTCG